MTVDQITKPSSRAAAEIRAEIARQGRTQGWLAAALGVPQAWVSRRLSPNTRVDLTIEEIVKMAKALGISPEGPLLYAIADSNREPAD